MQTEARCSDAATHGPRRTHRGLFCPRALGGSAAQPTLGFTHLAANHCDNWERRNFSRLEPPGLWEFVQVAPRH